VAVVDKVTDFLLFIGKVMVVGGVSTLAFFYFSGRIAPLSNVVGLPQLNYYLVPVIVRIS
jgi:choline transporter-like protein 2/4/5